MKVRVAGHWAVIVAICVAAPAFARNPNVSGGIQYVSQAQKEMTRQPEPNTEEGKRLFGKAITTLSKGLAEDPNDVEAWDYLGIAYAELDSTERAGWAFSEGIKLAQAAGSEKKKLLSRMQDNRKYYWVKHFNQAITTYRTAETGSGDDIKVDEGIANTAIGHMRQAIQVDPQNPQAYCTLAAFLVNVKRADEAIEVTRSGLAVAPEDSCLKERQERLAGVQVAQAAQSGDFGKAIAGYEKMLEKDPNDAGAAMQLGELYFKQGDAIEAKGKAETDAEAKKKLEADARAAFAHSAENFGKYSDLTPADTLGRFNYAVALSRAGQYDKLAQVAQTALMQQPYAPEYHSFMATAYRELGNDEASTAHTLVARMLKEGAKEADPAAYAQKAAESNGPASGTAKALKEWGAPDEVRTQTMGNYPVDAWFWWNAKRAAIFSKGSRVAVAEFAAVQQAPPKAAASTKKK